MQLSHQPAAARVAQRHNFQAMLISQRSPGQVRRLAVSQVRRSIVDGAAAPAPIRERLLAGRARTDPPLALAGGLPDIIPARTAIIAEIILRSRAGRELARRPDTVDDRAIGAYLAVVRAFHDRADRPFPHGILDRQLRTTEQQHTKSQAQEIQPPHRT